ncbi:hypothetical protein [Pantoea sp. CFSAN033090]|uniref:hypothetical protein n=1 Tax=Pantoea sp. CFSAN033090 TaxID=1690502 RepID=UPI00068F91C1|nr:hypothetical protein [Pantoea sp. CFSAN033090]KOA72250.1 hypothetical protein AFL22_00395 [Pantoea sp. CFSAN033090]
MSHTDQEFEDLQDLNTLYRSAILDTTEALGWGIEILTKVVAASNAGTLGSFSATDQYQAKQTLMYLKSRKDDNVQFRKPGDPAPRSFAQYDKG